MRHHKKNDAWKLADHLAAAAYELAPAVPREEMHGLATQFRRAFYSVPPNIAEGASRESNPDFPHFPHSTRGSLSEARCVVHTAKRLGWLSSEAAERLSIHTKLPFARLNRLIHPFEKESGRSGKIVAAASSLLILTAIRLGEWFLVSGQLS